MTGLFISYRRRDSSRWCARLADHLALRFGDELVFRDVDDLEPGMRWPAELDRALRGAEVVLVLIGPTWLSRRERLRLRDPRDVLRREIVTALQGRRRKVIPVLVGGASVPGAEELPAALRPLLEWQACALEDRTWRRDVERLVERLRELLPEVAHALDELKADLQRQQEAYFAVLDAAPARALARARATLRTLNRVCPRHPRDAELQLQRGYTDKNVAMALQRLGQGEEAARALDGAERTFRTAIAERPDDAGAWNGLGSVEAVRGHLAVALRHVRKALKLQPAYPAARQDEAQLVAALGGRGSRRARPAATRRNAETGGTSSSEGART